MPRQLIISYTLDQLETDLTYILGRKPSEKEVQKAREALEAEYTTLFKDEIGAIIQNAL